MSATGRPSRAAVLERDVRALVLSLGGKPEDVDKIFTVPARTKRSAFDFYETPSWTVDAILPHLIPPASDPAAPWSPFIVDAGAGTGALTARLSEKIPGAEILGLEIQADLVAKARARGLYNAEFEQWNFLKWASNDESPDLVIMNPPFSRALEFVQHAQKIAKRGATVVALLRLGWMAAKSRREFLKKHPADIHVLPRRPSFTGDGHTDASSYAWFVWSPTSSGKWEIMSCEFPRKKSGRKRAVAAARPNVATGSVASA